MIYIIIAVILIALSIMFLWIDADSKGTFSLIFLTMVWLCCGIGSHLHHTMDIAITQTQEKIISIQSEKVDRLKLSLTILKSNDNTLLNADTPLATLIEEIALSEKDLAIAKIELVAAKRRIIARSLSIFKFIVKYI